MPETHLEAIRYALELARQSGFAEVELRFEDVEFEARLIKNGRAPAAAQAIAAIASSEPADTPREALIESPCVGYFDGGGETLKVGVLVRQGDIVASVSALGLATDVESPATGEIVEVYVRSGEPVEFGQAIAKVKVTEP